MVTPTIVLRFSVDIVARRARLFMVLSVLPTAATVEE
jgi:hypothetical protein